MWATDAHHHARLGQRGRHGPRVGLRANGERSLQLRQAEVEYLHLSFRGHDDIGRRCRDARYQPRAPPRQRGGDLRGVKPRTSASGGPLGGNELDRAKVACDALHHQVVDAVVARDVVQRDDIPDDSAPTPRARLLDEPTPSRRDPRPCRVEGSLTATVPGLQAHVRGAGKTSPMPPAPMSASIPARTEAERHPLRGRTIDSGRGSPARRPPSPRLSLETSPPAGAMPATI